MIVVYIYLFCINLRVPRTVIIKMNILKRIKYFPGKPKEKKNMYIQPKAQNFFDH